MYIGFLVGVWCGAAVAGLDFGRFGSGSLVLLVPALIGGRLWYALQHRGSGQSGGSGLYGGLVLSFAASWPVVQVAGLDFWRYWDGAAVVLLVGMACTRVGCLMTGCCSGRPTGGPLGVRLPDHTGTWRRRYPTQLLEAAWSVAILAVGVALYSPSSPAGTLFLGAACVYGFGRSGLELLRDNAAITSGATRINLGFSLLLAVGTGLLALRVFP
jgi:phosphatidylglycerol:prolipoprotein diacylglycerol transferase